MSILKEYFPEFTDTQISKFEDLASLYKEWNEKINVISRKDIDNVLEHHILHSLSIMKFFSFGKKCSILDVGTGGGLPGIPLAIACPNATFHLIDGIKKKITVVENIISTLGLSNVTCGAERSETIRSEYNFITSRAVTAFPKFLEATKHCISPYHLGNRRNGILYLKGGDFLEEIEPFKKKMKIFNLSDHFEGEFFETKKLIYLPIS